MTATTTEQSAAAAYVASIRRKTEERQERLAEIRAGLEILWEPGDVREIRALDVGGRSKRTDAGWFDDLDKAAAAALKLDEAGSRGVYITANPCVPALLARANNRITEWAKQTTADHEILRRRWLPLDFDPDRPAGVSATDEEKAAAATLADEAEERLRAMGWPYPIIMDSGNGAYRLFRLDLENTDETRDLLKAALAGINAVLGTPDKSRPHAHLDLSMFNAARIIRVPGTTNRKGDDYRAGGGTR